MREGAALIGSGNLGQRIAVNTGDEFEALADQFNDMAAKLQESYADLEKKIERRTRELSETVEELRALGEVSQAVPRRSTSKPCFDDLCFKRGRSFRHRSGRHLRFDEARRRISAARHLRA